MIDDGHYKQIADELYEALKGVIEYLPDNDNGSYIKISDTLHKYEKLTNPDIYCGVKAND